MLFHRTSLERTAARRLAFGLRRYETTTALAKGTRLEKTAAMEGQGGHRNHSLDEEIKDAHCGQ